MRAEDERLAMVVDKRSTFWHISSACRLSELTHATPITADCQRSWSATSATATLKVCAAWP